MTTPARYAVTGRTAGQDVSSTYEGRYVGIEENMMVHPTHADGLVDKGDPVLVGDALVGVAMSDAAAATDIITIDTEGEWVESVIGAVSDGTADGIALALTAGDPIFINRATGVLSGMSDPGDWAPFGYVLGDVAAHVTTASTVIVKVHGKHCPDMGRLHYGAGFTAHADNYLLEGDSALRRNRVIEMCIAPESILLAGEQLHGFNIRLMDDLISTGGEITAGELKVVRNDTTAASVSSASALKLNADNKAGGVAPYEYLLNMKMEGAGTAPAIRALMNVESDGTAGTLEGWFNAASATAMGLKANVAAPGNTTHEIPIIIAGVRYCIPVVAWA